MVVVWSLWYVQSVGAGMSLSLCSLALPCLREVRLEACTCNRDAKAEAEAELHASAFGVHLETRLDLLYSYSSSSSSSTNTTSIFTTTTTILHIPRITTRACHLHLHLHLLLLLPACRIFSSRVSRPRTAVSWNLAPRATFGRTFTTPPPPQYAVARRKLFRPPARRLQAFSPFGFRLSLLHQH